MSNNNRSFNTGYYRGRGGDRGRGRRRGDGLAEVFLANQSANIDSRLKGEDQGKLVKSFDEITFKDDDMPARPGWGTLGAVIQLRVNYFPIKLPRGPLFEYELKITPEAKGRGLKQRIFFILEETAEYAQIKTYVAHDSSAKMIAATQLSQPLEFVVTYYDDDEAGPRQGGKTYTFEITFVQPLGLAKLENERSSEGAIESFFPDQTFTLGGGLEAWKGFYSSVRPAFKHLMVNVNIATTAFYQAGNLADKMLEWKAYTFGASFDAFVRGLRIKTTHLKYSSKKTILRVADKTAGQHSFFWDEESRDITIEQYFKRKYEGLRYADNLPLVEAGKGNYLPAEVCWILPGQPFRRKLMDRQTSGMITYARMQPKDKATNIVEQGLTKLGYDGATSLLNASGFNIALGQEMAVIPARVLPSPGITYSAKVPVNSQKASWNMLRVKFSSGATLLNWAVLSIKDGNRPEFSSVDDPALQTTICNFIKMCHKSGIHVRDEPRYIEAHLPRHNLKDGFRKTAITQIRTAIESLDPIPSIILVILSNNDSHIYSGLKHLCDMELDLHTVSAQSLKLRKEKGQEQYFANVALKFNVKLGGINQVLDADAMQWLKAEPTMLVGMDVTHPGPNSLNGAPSIAAVVASTDNYFAQYPASLRLQETKKEMITEVAEMMKERLEQYQRRNNKLPSRVVVFRDGVSEGQYKTVILEEMPEIRKSFAKVSGTDEEPYNPKLSIVVCTKRHHTTAFATKASQADDNGNPLPGTVIDRGITSIYNHDFFLQSHAALQGTTRSTHYFVVHDEIKFTADELQKLTNDISYMFARATRAVSLIPPVYYASLACERGRSYIHDLLHGSNPGTRKGDKLSPQEVYQHAERLWGNGVGQKLSETMFYL